MTQPVPHRATGRRGWSPKVWGSSVVAGLLLITIALVLTVGHDSPRRTGQAVPLVTFGRLPGDSGSSAPAPADRRQHSGAPVPAGSRLRLARLGVDAPISSVGVTGNVMQIPRDPHTVGWWTGGAAPGDSRGTTVIVGHINYAGVTGALAALPDARAGDVVVLSEPHHDVRYRLVAVRSYPKATGLPADVFRRTGPARLVLITCGGQFDPASGNYEDNIVGYAEPAE